MNYAYFDLLYTKSMYDEIKVIGKDVERDGVFYHVMGMTLKDKKATLHVLEYDSTKEEDWDEYDMYGEEILPRVRPREQTPRERMKESARQRERSMFLHLREIKSNGASLKMSGGQSGALRNSDYGEAYLLFYVMRQAGWRLTEASVFYEADWEVLAITECELREEYEHLPDLDEPFEISYDVMPTECVLELPVTFEVGQEATLSFSMTDGQGVECYINKVYTMDMWAEEEKRFADKEYRERMLAHVSEEELEHMKQHFFEVLAEICPRGQHYMVVEYECTQDVALRFYDKSYLDTVPQPQAGSASSLVMIAKPEETLGSHGLKLQGCVIQTPLPPETKRLAAELFSYCERVKKEEMVLA